MNQPSITNGSKYVEIVNHIREMIDREALKPGDKLPSERSLCERLDVGRSSIREALRALELLGLIETRKGEGTFLRDFQGHQLVQLISTFILQDHKAKQDVIQTKDYIQLNCLMIAIDKMNTEQAENLTEWITTKKMSESEFFLRIIKIADNFLHFRLWTILDDYYHALGFTPVYWGEDDYKFLLESVKTKDRLEIVKVYKKLKDKYNDSI
ncbi:FadR/GntR family transcriptional regulator [Niallia sp. 03133]|uniref:FadR/GntR family transcriptional regulator n=1 Tax=Niallia sp. 03133 TaxID=3458060 RepID=UPI004044CCD6